jgi:hypothetical protein
MAAQVRAGVIAETVYIWDQQRLPVAKEVVQVRGMARQPPIICEAATEAHRRLQGLKRFTAVVVVRRSQTA